MLINIGEIKDKLGVLTTISSNVSSILSKVNSLGSQKKLSVSYISSGSVITENGEGLAFVFHTYNSSTYFHLTVNGGAKVNLNVAPNVVIPVPFTNGVKIECSANSYQNCIMCKYV